MKFKDVAHLYIGSAILLDPELWENRHEANESVSVTKMRSNDYHELYGRGNIGDELPDHVSKNLKPVLRKLADITDDEIQQCEGITYDYGIFEYVGPLASYLLSRGFDIHNLIDLGEAIDAETLTPNPYRV
jgi:hypothetical protein